MKKSLVIFGLVLSSIHLVAQQLPMLPSMQPAYTNQTRDLSGKPGKNYWQNKANYALKADFNPDTRLLKGTE
ncbi:MAG: peptidase, partial [Pedobacter sp.]